jgi:hypothetical protein
MPTLVVEAVVFIIMEALVLEEMVASAAVVVVPHIVERMVLVAR